MTDCRQSCRCTGYRPIVDAALALPRTRAGPVLGRGKEVLRRLPRSTMVKMLVGGKIASSPRLASIASLADLYARHPTRLGRRGNDAGL